jgi:starvation-inducible DNA-binding protein
MNTTETLNTILATNYVLYLKTQNFHWNVEGPTFMMLHKFFEEQYEALAAANDEIAERIRALGALAPGSMKEFLAISLIKESANDVSAENMLKTLLADNQTVADNLTQAASGFAENGDDVTADLLTTLNQYHQEKVWMLKSLLA